MAGKTSAYLEYLDKEMTIMGILSTFCVAVVALVLDRVGAAEPSKGTLFSALWHDESLYVLVGSAGFAGAGALFYLQRSALAWFYGQISLSLETPSVNNTTVDSLYKDADSWGTWICYQLGFTAVATGAAFYAYALIATGGRLRNLAWLLWTFSAAAGIIQIDRMLISQHFKYAETPMLDFWRKVRGKPEEHPE